jgi:hypothetical protein
LTKTTHRWESLPGNFDKLNTFMLFASDNKYGIPTVKDDNFIPDWLVPYKTRIRTERDTSGGAIHTFLDDYRFEVLWHRPVDTLTAIQSVGASLTPDFSTYNSYPYAMQIWNVYRNRWLGAYWQAHGVKVIPTISWAQRESYEFCFCGVPKDSIVALSTVGILREAYSKGLFMEGYKEMTKRIEPRMVICYGEDTDLKLDEYNIVKYYPSYWKSIRDALKGGKR